MPHHPVQSCIFILHTSFDHLINNHYIYIFSSFNAGKTYVLSSLYIEVVVWKCYSVHRINFYIWTLFNIIFFVDLHQLIFSLAFLIVET